MKERKPIIGRNEGDVFAEFIAKDYCVCTGSDGDETGGWWRILNWMKGYALRVKYDANGTINGYWWE